ncbi:MAG: AbrB/MazE/SpoVT family DNA-binding domain-containing protein [Candidatus Bathyarchaeota archaeon]|nr:AbrB/MazE/SpoVT family DNA-binding domain-containing protein [Candidatus Bathyarchaeota archaeon]
MSTEEKVTSGTISTLTYATSKKDSLRTTVPRAIVNQFGLKSGDKLVWRFHVVDGKLCVVIEPVKESTK